MTEDTLRAWDHFHDWYLDSIQVGSNKEPRTLKLGLYLKNDRAVVTFHGVTCVSFDRLSLLNIVYGIRVVKPEDANYARACAVLSLGERLTKKKADMLVFLYSTLGAEIAIECDSLCVEAIETNGG